VIPEYGRAGFRVGCSIGTRKPDKVLLFNDPKSVWQLGPGLYTLRGIAIINQSNDPEHPQWTGEMPLEPVTFRVTAEQCAIEPMRR
jgi:hypothetical protein